jgi:hypothetical protein
MSLLCALIVITNQAAATPALIQSKDTSGNGTQITLSTPASAGNLLVVICGANASSTITGPSGFSAAINQSGSTSQGIFYKIAAGNEQSLSCGFTNSPTTAVQAYEFSGIHGSPSTLEATSSSSGTTSPYSVPAVTTVHANDLLIVGYVNNIAGKTAISLSAPFQERSSVAVTSGPQSNRAAFVGGSQVVSTAGNYAAAASGENVAWRGQIAAFRATAVSSALGADIVDGSGNPVNSPTIAMTNTPIGFSCQTATGTLGSSTQKIRVTNTTDNPAWSLTIAASGGPTAKWQAGSKNYAFNMATGCIGGQLTVDATAGTVAAQAGCSTANTTKGTAASFANGTVDAITLMTAANSPNYIDCYWDLTGVALSQKVPAGQANGSYSLNLTLTITAN